MENSTHPSGLVALMTIFADTGMISQRSGIDFTYVIDDLDEACWAWIELPTGHRVLLQRLLNSTDGTISVFADPGQCHADMPAQIMTRLELSPHLVAWTNTDALRRHDDP